MIYSHHTQDRRLACQLLYVHKAPSAPPVGIITNSSNLRRAILDLLIGRGGVRLAFGSDDKQVRRDGNQSLLPDI